MSTFEDEEERFKLKNEKKNLLSPRIDSLMKNYYDLFEKNKNVEFISLFSLQNTHYKIDYTTLFKEIKNIKKHSKEEYYE